MKQALSYIILLPVFVSFMTYACGMHIFFEVELHHLKNENYIAGKKLKEHEHELVDMAIPIEEIAWVHDHEIIWKGEYYDITDKEIRGSKLYCRAYHDVEEKELTEQYAKHNQSHHPGNSENDQGGKTIQPFIVCEVWESGILFYLLNLEQQHAVVYPFDFSTTCFQPPKV